MGLFDKFLKAVGFEDEEEIETEEFLKKKKEKKEKIPTAKFNLKNKSSSKTFLPETRQDLNHAVKLFSNGENVLIDFSGYKENAIEARAFLSGACFALKGELKKLDENLFLLEV